MMIAEHVIKDRRAALRLNARAALLAIVSAATCSVACGVTMAAEPEHRIVGLRRLEGTFSQLGHGDNWHMTWAADDKQYTALCDGTGFAVPGDPLRYNNSRIYAITGSPPDHRFEYLPGYPQLDGGNGFYNFGILALDDHIYSFLSHMAKTPDREYQLAFVGAKLIDSADNGKTWNNRDGTPCTWAGLKEAGQERDLFFHEPGDAFSLLTVLQMGRGYEHNTDGYVYVYAPNGNSPETMAQLVLCRTPKHKIRDRGAYEFFVGRSEDGSARWSRDIRDRRPVHVFPDGWVNRHAHPYAWHPSVVFNEPLGVYMMANWGMGVDDDGAWFGKPSYLGFWIAPRPWGPWSQIHEERQWLSQGDPKTRAYQPQIAPKWIAPDGKSFWLVWTDFRNGGKPPHYSFNCEKVLILTSDETP